METYCGDALAVLRTMGADSIHTCVTSPPYYHLRDYGIPGQIGMESTPEEYIARLTEVFREVWRVLRPDGTLWINIGDSYAGGNCRYRMPAGLKPKDLMGIPWLLAFALRPEGWYLRQDIIWNKPNCMPESVRDRCTKSHEYIFLLSKSPQYYFDVDAIREPYQTMERKGQRRNYQPGMASSYSIPHGHAVQHGNFAGLPLNPKGKNKRDVWTVSTGGFKGAHFAVYPEQLIEPCILAGCPEDGTVLDPFMGSGTTGAAAKRLRRDFVGIELNPEYCEMARERIAATEVAYEQTSIDLEQTAVCDPG